MNKVGERSPPTANTNGECENGNRREAQVRLQRWSQSRELSLFDDRSTHTNASRYQSRSPWTSKNGAKLVSNIDKLKQLVWRPLVA